jgi:hypothetical protein
MRTFLAALTAILFSADCIGRPVPSFAAGSGHSAIAAVSEASSAASPTAHEVIFSASPSILRVSNPWWPWSNVDTPCATFRVSAAASIEALDLYTSGLGRSLLGEARNDQGAICLDPKQLHDRIVISKEKPSAVIDRFITIRLDSSSLSTPGASMQGAVIAMVGTKRLGEFALKVERPARDELWTAATWTATILIPALIAFWGNQLATSLAARRKEDDDFRAYRFEHVQQIIDFMENDVRPIIGSENVEHPGRLIFDLLRGKNEIFSKIPEHEVRRLMKAVISEDVRRIDKILRQLFPEVT